MQQAGNKTSMGLAEDTNHWVKFTPFSHLDNFEFVINSVLVVLFSLLKTVVSLKLCEELFETSACKHRQNESSWDVYSIC